MFGHTTDHLHAYTKLIASKPWWEEWAGNETSLCLAQRLCFFCVYIGLVAAKHAGPTPIMALFSLYSPVCLLCTNMCDARASLTLWFGHLNLQVCLQQPVDRAARGSFQCYHPTWTAVSPSLRNVWRIRLVCTRTADTAAGNLRSVSNGTPF